MINRCIKRLFVCHSWIFFKVPSLSKSHSTSLKKMEAVKTIKDLGYAFNSAGELRRVTENGEPGEEPFQFNISDKHRECQSHYEEIGSAVTEYVYHLLETQENLTRLPVPKESTPDTGTFVFASKNYDSKDTLLILIHGSGVVRAGQWARSLIINENLEKGTQIPYIKKALKKDYGVLILNTNDNLTPNGDDIDQSRTPEEHGLYVWKNYVLNTKASSILIVAHSYGGVVTVALANKLKEDFEKRVKAIAFTDSVHGYSAQRVSQLLKKVARNWVASSEPLDTPIETRENDVPEVSAGHRKHEMTSYSCIESVFKFFEEKLQVKGKENK